MTQLEWALRYFDAGWQVMPCADKRPITDAFEAWNGKWEWLQTNRPTRRIIEWWWTNYPEAQIALICGKISGVTVVDVDTHVDEKKWPGMPLEDVGKIVSDKLTLTVMSTTGSGGRHLFYRYVPIKNSAQIVAPQIDVKSDGGYVILPESFHEKSQKNYVWDTLFPFHETSLVSGLGDVPSWIIKRSQEAKNDPMKWEKAFSGVGTGSRNSTLAEVTGKLLCILSPEIVWKLVRSWNLVYNTPPLGETELYTTFMSIVKKEYGKQRQYPRGNR